MSSSSGSCDGGRSSREDVAAQERDAALRAVLRRQVGFQRDAPAAPAGGMPAARSLASREFAPTWQTSTIVDPKHVM